MSPPISPVETDRYLKDTLAERFRLVVIDEAQWLNRECCEYLRHLHDERRTRFALLFVGGAGCYEVLRREPMLSSRIYAQVRFAPLTPAQVAKMIPIYHDIYAGASVGLIELVDRHFAHGNFRDWAKFTQHAARLLKGLGREHLDEEVARTSLIAWQTVKTATVTWRTSLRDRPVRDGVVRVLLDIRDDLAVHQALDAHAAADGRLLV